MAVVLWPTFFWHAQGRLDTLISVLIAVPKSGVPASPALLDLDSDALLYAPARGECLHGIAFGGVAQLVRAAES